LNNSKLINVDVMVTDEIEVVVNIKIYYLTTINHIIEIIIVI